MDLIKTSLPSVYGERSVLSVPCGLWTLPGSRQVRHSSMCSATIGSYAGAFYAFTLPSLPDHAKRRKNDALRFRTGRTGAVQAQEDGYLLPVLHVLGAALQITNTYGDLFLGSFASIPEYADSFGVKHSVILLSISQMSETLFILAITFFLKHFGIKRVMLISMFAWVFRFGLFALGDPGSGLWMLILSMIVYGMAFDFFNVSGSLFTEMEAHLPSVPVQACSS